MTSSAWVLARRGRCGPCIALMTKKVEEGRRRVRDLYALACKFGAPPRLSFLHALNHMSLVTCA